MEAFVITVDGAGLEPAQARIAQLALNAHFAAAGVEPHYAAEAWFAQECGARRKAPPALAKKMHRAACAWCEAQAIAAASLGIESSRVKLNLTPPLSGTAEPVVSANLVGRPVVRSSNQHARGRR